MNSIKSKNITDMKKEKIKTNDKDVKLVLTMLIDFTEKLAKSKTDMKNIDKYLQQAIKKYQKQLEETPEKNENEVKLLNDLAKEILPKTLNEEETKKIITEHLKNCGEISKKCFGYVMKELKNNDNVDMKMASKILNAILDQ